MARACSASHQALEEIYEDSQVPFVLAILGGFTCQHNMNEHQIAVCHQKPPGSVHGEVFWNRYRGYCFQLMQEENVVIGRCEMERGHLERIRKALGNPSEQNQEKQPFIR